MTTLLLSQRQTDDTQALWRAAIQRGWSVERLQYGLTLDVDDPVIYMGPLFAYPTAKALGVTLLEPEENWLPRLPYEYRKRVIAKTTLGEVSFRYGLPVFMKPPNDKSFEARVYYEAPDLPSDTVVLVSEVVEWEYEFRCFMLDGQYRTMCGYVGPNFNATQFIPISIDVEEFAGEVLANVPPPRAIVLDIGKIRGRGLAVVEANGAWGSGIYRCDPNAVLDVVKEATIHERTRHNNLR